MAKTESPADIILFPGVRYERQPEQKPENRKKPKRRRDTLQLEG